MPPKKTKKGGKKKGKKGKKDKLSSNEKFLQLRICLATDNKKALEEKRLRYASDRGELESRHAGCVAERDKIVGMFRAQTQEITTELSSAETAAVGTLRDAIQAKHQFIRDQDAAVAQQQQEIAHIKELHEEVLDELAFLTRFRDEEQHTFHQQIRALKASIALENESFAREQQDVPRYFGLSNQLFSGELERALLGARQAATEYALQHLSAKERGLWCDLQWLQEEYERHLAEAERLTVSCEALESENLRMLRRSSMVMGACPAWWDSPASYREHAERMRLESMLSAEGADNDGGMGEGEGVAVGGDGVGGNGGSGTDCSEQSDTEPASPAKATTLAPSRISPRLSTSFNSSLFSLSESSASPGSAAMPAAAPAGVPGARCRVSPGANPTSLAANLSSLPPVRHRNSILLSPSPAPPTQLRHSFAHPPAAAAAAATGTAATRRTSTLAALGEPGLARRRSSTTTYALGGVSSEPALDDETRARLDRMVLFPRLARQTVAGIGAPRLSMT